MLVRKRVDLEIYTVSDKEPNEISEAGLGERKYKMKSMDPVCIFFITCVCVCVCVCMRASACVCVYAQYNQVVMINNKNTIQLSVPSCTLRERKYWHACINFFRTIHSNSLRRQNSRQSDLDVVAALVEVIQVGENTALARSTIRWIGNVLHDFTQTATRKATFKLIR